MGLLHKLKAVVNINQKRLITSSTAIAIPIYYDDKTENYKNCHHTILIYPGIEKNVKMSVCYQKGLGILVQINFGNLE